MKNRGFGLFVATLLLISLLGAAPILAEIDTPTNLQAESQPGGEILLTWDAVSGATTYKLYWSTTLGSQGSVRRQTSDTFATFSVTSDGLPANYTIYFWVTADNGSEESAPATASAVCDTLAPPAVTLLSPTDGSFVLSDQPTLSWSAVIDGSGSGMNASGLDHYEMQYSTSSDFNPSVTVTVGDIATTTTAYTPQAHLVSSTFYWRVRGVDVAGNALDWTSASVNVNSFIINMNAPTLITPSNGSYSNDVRPTFSWTQVDGASGYEILVDDGPSDFTTPIYTFDVLGGTTTSYSPLNSFIDGTYYWKISAKDSLGQSVGIYSSVWSFSIDTVAPGIPTITAPADESTVSSAPTLTWNAVTGAEEYALEVSLGDTTTTGGDFVSTYYTYPTGSNALGTTSHIPSVAFVDGTYYWHVRSLDDAENESDWSTVWSFTVDTTLPSAPVPTAPSEGATVTSSTPTFSWQGVTGASSYTLQYSTTSTFTSTTTVTKTVSTLTYTVPADDALDNDDYYWKVASSQDSDLYSDTKTFTVDVPESEQPVDFTITVREGATGNVIEDANVVVSLDSTTVSTGGTNEEGVYALTLTPDTYTLTVSKNLWDDGVGNTYTKSIVVESGMANVVVNLYQNGNDLLVATVRYNNNSIPQTVSIYRNGVLQSTVQLPKLPIPTSLVPSHLQSVSTNLIMEVPSSGSYTIADPNYPDDKIAIVYLSKTLSSSTNNLVIFEVTSALSGIVVDEEGEIITGATVKVIRTSDDSIVASSESAALGFQFTQLLPGTYYLIVTKSGYEDMETSNFTISANETKNYGMVTLVQKTGTLNITVQTEDGQLVNNASVEVKDTTQTVVFSQVATQGIVGTQLPSGTYSISASAEDYTLQMPVGVIVIADETSSKNVIMIPDEPVEPETGTMQISITDEEGNPVSLVEIFFGEEKKGATNENGLLIIEELDPGSYEVTLSKEGFVDVTQTVEIVAGDTASITPSMEEEQVADTGSRVKWILVAFILILVFAIGVYMYTQNKPRSEGESASGDVPKPATGTQPTIKTSQPETKKESMLTPRESSKTTGGIPSNSVKKSIQKDDRPSGGLPSKSIKDN